ncbi:MAG: type II toxin-antitoxin system YhaV family toxin [Phormidesmis sp.]
MKYYGCVNNPSTKRAYGRKSDAYKVFGKMLKGGHPPNDWDQLLSAAESEDERFGRILS